MYRSYFGLRERPFDLTPNPKFLVLTDPHREALSNLEYGIASRRGITVLVGEAGTGKTTLIRAALQQQPEQVHCVHLQNPALSRAEFIEMLAIRFGLSDSARASKSVLLIELETMLRTRHERGESSVLIVDEAQSLPLDLLEELRLLGNIETEETKLLSIVMAGQPELAMLLNQASLRQLRQRIALRCELRALTQAETAGYLAGRVRLAGGIGSQIFTREAVVLIHQRSNGIPRTVSVIADNSLVTAFALGRKPVDSEVVNEVCRDLGLQPAEPPPPQAVPAPAAKVQRPTAETPTPINGSERPRMFAMDTSDQRPATPAPEAAVAQGTTGLFNNMYPKRRRFFFFSRSGSR
jgi:general secretion pathway protein A